MAKKRKKTVNKELTDHVLERTEQYFTIKPSKMTVPIRHLVYDLPPGITEPPIDLTLYHHLAREIPLNAPPAIFATYHPIADRDTNMSEFFQLARQMFLGINLQCATKTVSHCEHKLHAVLYHLRLFKERIASQEQWFANEYTGNGGLSRQDATLIYETEAFLFQAVSNIDVLIKLLAMIIPELKLNSFTSQRKPVYIAGGKAIEQLRNAGRNDIADIFEQNRLAWIQQMIIWRDIITHDSNLENFLCFVPESYIGGDKMHIYYPTMPVLNGQGIFGERVDLYCNNIYTELCKLYRSVLSCII